MSKFIIVSGSYDPYPTANGVCAKAVEEALRIRGHEVIYMVTRNNILQKKCDVINGNKVYFIPKIMHEVHSAFNIIQDSFLNNNIEKNILKYTHIALKFLFKISAFCKGKSSRDSAITIYKQNFIHIMSELLLNEKPDGILSFSVPFHSHLYTHEVLVKTGYETLWASFLIDAHQHKIGLSKKHKRVFAKEEAIVFENVDICFFLDVLQENYNTTNYKEFGNKFNYFKLPFFKIPLSYKAKETIGIAKTENTIDITFAGTLYDDSSPIHYFSSFIKECKDTNIRFHLMGKFYPKTMKILEELMELMPNQIRLYGFVRRDFVLASLQRSDILINIGNNNTNQIPSKILEYIGLQKPFFSFIRDEKDAAIEYLDLYPHAYVINENKEDSMKIVVKEAMAFFKNCKKEQIETNTLRNNFKGYLQEDVTGKIVETIENTLYEKK
ncbi:hypothetical protein N9Q58_03150 [Polaribacter sp.]|nr:hypothetical protein [Polaribacter sp.]